ncbi:MAG: helix-turn-helix domain-containing protein [Blastopirellula sp. JB062]
MAKLIPLSEAAEILGVSEEQLVEMRSRNEIHGYRDGASWKFKEAEIDRIKAELAGGGQAAAMGDSGEDMIEPPSDSDDESDFELSLGGDEGSSGEIDSLLIQDEGRGGDSGVVIGDELSSGGSDLKLADSDIELGFEKGSSAIDPASDTNSGLNLDLEGSDVLGSSSLNAPVDNDDDDDELLLSPIDQDDVGVGTEKRDPEGTGSGVSLALGDEDLDLGESAVSAIDDLDSGELTLDAGDSGVSLVDPADSGIDIGMEPLDLSGSKVDAFELAGDSGVEVDQEPASGISASKGGGEDDFLLTPVEGELDDDDSGSQVIALDSDSIGSESALFGSGIEEGDFGSQEPGLEVADEMGAMDSAAVGAAPAAAAPVEAPYSVLNIISLAATAALVLVAGMMVTDLIRNMWSFDEPYAINSSIMDGIISLMGV